MVEPTTVVPDSTVLNSTPVPVPVAKAPEDVLFNPPKLVDNMPPVVPPVPPVAPVEPAKPTDTKPPVTPASTDAPPVTPTETKPPTETPKPDAKPATETPPMDYVLKAPEGSLLSVEEVKSLNDKAKAEGLTKEQAEGVLKAKDESVKAFASRQEKTLEQAKIQWKQDCEKDPDIGGEKYAENIELAHRAWERVADKELRTLAEKTGFGSHPSVVRMLVRVGKMMAEDKLIRGDIGAVPQEKSAQQKLYGATTPGA